MKYKLRKFLLEERAKLRNMTLKEAVRYIWQYFGLFIVGIIGLISLIIYAVIHFLSGSPEYWIYAVFANSTSNVTNNSRIWRDFVAESGYDTSVKRVEFSSNMYFDYRQNQARGNSYYDAFVALSDTGTLDIIMMYPEQLASLGQSGRLLDWNTDSCLNLRENYASRLIYYEPPESADQTDPIPVGIDISDSLLISKYGIYEQSCALGISPQSTRLDAVEEFLNFILKEE